MEGRKSESKVVPSFRIPVSVIEWLSLRNNPQTWWLSDEQRHPISTRSLVCTANKSWCFGFKETTQKMLATGENMTGNVSNAQIAGDSG